MSRSRRFLSGLLLTYGYQGMLLLAGIWLTPFYLRQIGQHDYGLWLVGTQLLTYLSLTDFGVVELLPLEVAYATGRAGGVNKADDLSFRVGQTARLILYQLPIVVAVALVMFFAIPAEWQGLRGPLSIILLGFIIAFPLRILPALLKGLQDLSFTGTVQLVGWALSTTATVAMVYAGWNLFALAVGWLVTQLALTPIFFYRIWTRFPAVLPKGWPAFDWKRSREQVSKGLWISVSQIAQLLTSNTDLLIIGKLLGPDAVVPYACTGKLIYVLGNQAQILMQTATPGLCEMKTGESRERLLRVLLALTHGLLTFSGLVVCVVLVVNHWFVNWWVTGKQYGGFALTVAILITILVRHWSTTTSYAVFCFGHQRRISLTNLADGVVSSVSCAILTLIFGLPGAAIGLLAGALFVSLPFNLRAIARDTNVTVARLVSGMLQSWFWRFVPLAGASLWLALHWSPKTLFEAAGVTIAITLVYSLVMLPNLLRSPLGIYIRAMYAPLRRMFRRSSDEILVGEPDVPR